MKRKAAEKRYQMDKYNLDWETACEEAIKMNIQEERKQEGKAA